MVIQKRVVTVFGNPIEPQDNLAVRLVPLLEERFKNIDFKIEDPTEILEPPNDPWVILDVAQGIDDVTVIEDLKDLEHIHGDSVHDYDVYMELRLREKLGELPRLHVVLVPFTMNMTQARRDVVRVLENIL